MDVVVNLPEGDVALLFIGGSEETAWQIGWTEGTRLQAVALVKLPGGGRQVLAGIPPHVPTFVPSDGPGTCADLQSFSHFPSLIPGGEDFSGGEDFKWDQVFDAAAKLFGVRATAVFTFNKGGSSIVAGRPLKGSERIVTASPPPEAFVDKTLLSKDRLALEESVEEGILAYPTHEDARAWLESAGLLTPSPDVEGPTSSKGRLTLPWGRLYTVRRPYSIPKGVEGGIGLIVPRGVATPSGVVEGGIEIFDVASGTCRGDGKCYELTGGKKTMEAEKNE